MLQEEGDRGISMNNDVIVITDTLNRVAARAGDPASLVFKRLFAGNCSPLFGLVSYETA
jgi:hypothetical protein